MKKGRWGGSEVWGKVKGEKMNGRLDLDGCVDEKKDRLVQLKWEWAAILLDGVFGLICVDGMGE